MLALRTALRRTDDEAGLGLIEVLVAMLIFAFVSVGIAASVLTTLKTTQSNKLREVAANLAAQEIDEVRAVSNPVKVFSETSTPTVGGTVFTVTREVKFVSPTGIDLSCTTTSSPLRYKRVSVSVQWPGLPDSAVVRSDTLLVPNTRLTDEEKGILLISVEGADGKPRAGVPFTVTGTTTPSTTPTDADGCSYVLGVTPGNYTVTLAGTGWLDNTQKAAPFQTVTGLQKGGTVGLNFVYEKAATYPLNLASNRAAATVVTPPLATVPVTFQSLSTMPQAKTTNPQFYPDTYQAFAGPYTAPVTNAMADGCAIADPRAWNADTRVTPNVAGLLAPGVSAAPGATAPIINVPMGLVELTGPASGTSNRYVVAERVTGIALASRIPGEPACTTALAVNLGQILPISSGKVTIALPWGRWKLSYRNDAGTGTGTALDGTRAKILAGLGAVIPPPAVTAAGVLVLDPRGATP